MTAESPSTDRLAEAAPLSDEELALMERLWAGHQTYVRQLLDEVYRLRARLDTAEGQLATARTQQMCTVIGTYVAWDIDNAKRNDRPITHSIADKSEGKLRGAMATFQELLVALGEIEGDEDLEEVWEVVEAAMAADNPHGPEGVSR